jgi:hypothetical protein
MIWITRAHPRIDRIACAWLTLRFTARVYIDGSSRRKVPLSRPLPFRPRRHRRRGCACRTQSIVRFGDPSK